MSPRIANRRAFYDYDISEKLEVGIQLLGSEVKAVRQGKVSLAEGFAQVRSGLGKRAGKLELVLINVDIGTYQQAGVNQHEPKRQRQLLAHKRQLSELAGRVSDKGTTLVPLAMYFVRGKAKLEIGIGKGKRQADKRQSIKQRDDKRQMRAAMTKKRI